MKRILATTSVAALAVLGFAGTASAAPADAACFGQIHKAINKDKVLAPTFNNVGEFVREVGGQGKNETARSLAAGGFCDGD